MTVTRPSAVGNRTETEVVKISELKPYDQIISGAVLGPVSVIERLKVKSSVAADRGKYAVTFFDLGTLFLHANLFVEILPAWEIDDGDDD